MEISKRDLEAMNIRMTHKNHPVIKAEVLDRAFKAGSLKDSPSKEGILPICEALISLYFGKMPWRVRFFALVTGRIPFDYLEDI